MDLLSIDSLSDEQIAVILDEGELWLQRNRAGPGRHDRLDGRIACNLFFENSTRTLMSFSIAALRLGAQVLTLPVERSSVSKGESLDDTIRTLDCMSPDILIVRHRDNRSAERIAGIMRCPVINAGDGTNEHPTQALLDALTLRLHFGRIEGLTVAICGDIRHSRVARSGEALLSRLGATVRLAGPPELLPDGFAGCGTVDDAIAGADAVIMLRIQSERIDADLGDLPGQYLERYGLTKDRFAKSADNAVIMHPGPMNRGVEIDSALADDPRHSLIGRQVETGVAVRMACLDLVANGLS